MSMENSPEWEFDSQNNYWTFTQIIEKSQNDKREYRLIKLVNDLQVLLVHDPETDKSSANLNVHVGHMSDPDDLQGLAHFCEHLLFMGTEKYPEENNYKRYLAEHAGASNASTGIENTNFYFDVGYEHLEGALDRFAQFFICPLFSESCTQREINAVDSEFRRNKQLDQRRMYQLEKSLSNPKHPYWHFGTGNLKTLSDNPKKSGKDVRQALIKFHESYYSSNIMRLCILGRESLDQLTKWAVEKFSNIRNKKISPPSFNGHPLSENELKKEIFVKPIKDIRSLKLVFPLPDQKKYYVTQPGYYICHLIAHEGQGSILSLLKNKGWANTITADSSSGGIGFNFLRITVGLTEEGLEHYKDIVLILFKYIDLLKRKGVQEYIFQEIQSLESIDFQFQEKTSPSSYTTSLSRRMQYGYPPNFVISGPHLLRKYNPELISKTLELINPDCFRIMLVAQTPPNNIKFTKVEPIHKTDYEVVDFDPLWLESLKNPVEEKELALPTPNEFIPTNFNTHKSHVDAPAKQPDLIKETSLVHLWHKKDDTFWVPKATLLMKFKTPVAYLSPENCVKTRLYTDLLEDALQDYSYNAQVAGLDYGLDGSIEGLSLSFQGYNDKLKLLLQRVIEAMCTLKIDHNRFYHLKEKLMRAYKNFKLENPIAHASYYISYIGTDRLWLTDEKIKALELLTPKDVQVFFPALLKSFQIEVLAHGNLFKEEVIEIVEKIIIDKIRQYGDINGLSSNETDALRSRSLLIPEKTSWVYSREVEDPKNENSSILYTIQVGSISDRQRRVKLSLLAQIVKQPFFQRLRTEEQLGYIVQSGEVRQSTTIAMRFGVQSIRDPVYLENRIENFLQDLVPMIESMSDSDFKTHIQSLVARKLEKDKNMYQETNRYWNHIQSGFYEFDKVEKDVEILQKIEKDDMILFIKDFIVPGNSTKLSVHMRSQKLVHNTKLSNIESASQISEEVKNMSLVDDQSRLPSRNKLIIDVVAFRSSLELGPIPQPL